MDCVEINLKEIDKLIHSNEFIQFLLSHSTELGTSIFIIQTLQEAINTLQETINKENNEKTYIGKSTDIEGNENDRT